MLQLLCPALFPVPYFGNASCMIESADLEDTVLVDEHVRRAKIAMQVPAGVGLLQAGEEVYPEKPDC